MASLLAIVSRKAFETEARIDGRLVAPGDVWPVARYDSASAALRKLDAGGTLFLVTVRPGEVPWLVAVLESPSFDGTRWTAAPNTRPVAPLDDVLPRLLLATGAGIDAPPGRLGMALQTPRVLTDADVALLLGVAPALPPTPAVADPVAVARDRALLHLAPDTVGTLDAAAASARRAPGRAVRAFKDAGKALGKGLAQIRVADWGAEALRASGKGKEACGLFALARRMEKSAKIPAADRVDPDAWIRFAGLTSFDPALLAIGLAALPPDQRVALAADVSVAGDELSGDVLDALDPEAVRDVIRAACDRVQGGDAAFWERWGSVAAEVAPVGWVVCGMPSSEVGRAAWRAVVAKIEGGAWLADQPSDEIDLWLEFVLREIRELAASDDGLAWLDAIGARIAGRAVRPLDVGTYADPDLLDVLLSHRLPLTLAPDAGLDWNSWRARRPLGALTADPIGARLVGRSLRNLAFTDHPGFDGGALVPAAALPALRPVFEGLADEIRAIRTVGTLAEWTHALGRLAFPRLAAAVPEIGEAIRGLDPAVLLRDQLRAGSMDEWVWPAQELASEVHGKDVNQYDTDGPFPNWVTWDKDTGRIVVVGPPGVVFDGSFAVAPGENVRTLRYVDGDVLVFTLRSSLKVGRWLSAPEKVFDMELWATWGFGLPVPGGGVTEGGAAYRPGDTAVPWSYARLLGDGTRFWRGDEAFDPRTGASLGEGRPDWFGGGDVTELRQFYPVPTGTSPLGARDGQYGFRAFDLGSGRYRGEAIDGTTWEGPVPGKLHALFRFPERDGVYPVVHGFREWSVRTSDGQAVVPATHGGMHRYWRGAPQWLPQPYWHLLVPRDPVASRALASCSLEAARALLDAARPMPAEAGSASVSGGTTMVLTAAPQRAAEQPAIVAAIREVLPEVTDLRLAAGLASIVAEAGALAADVARWREALDTPPTDHPGRDDQAFAAIGRLFGQWSFGEGHLEDQVQAAARWFAEGPDDGHRHPPGCRLAWERLATHAGAVAHRIAAPGTPDDVREQLRAMLDLWTSSGLADRKLRLIGVAYEAWPVAGMTHHDGDLLLAHQGHRWLLRLRKLDGKPSFVALEVEGPGGFAVPPGGTLLWAEEARPLVPGEARILSEPAAARAIADATGLLYPTALRLWTGALGPWAPTPALRKVLGLTVADLALSDREGVGQVDDVYAAAWPPTPASIAAAWNERFGRRTPLAVDVLKKLLAELRADQDSIHWDLGVIADPDRPFLTVDLPWVIRPWRGFQSSVSYMRGSIPPGWPKHASQGAEDQEPDRSIAFSGWALRRFARLIPWAHLELPVGDPHRAGVARIAASIAERLRNPELLLLAGAVDLSEETDPAALAAAFAEIRGRFDGPAYRGDGGEVAAGVDRGDLVVTSPKDLDNSLFLSFRPARLTDPDALRRLAADLGVGDAFRRTGGGCTCGLNFGAHKVVDVTDLASWLVWQSDGYQRIVSRLADPGLPDGVFEADPRVTAKDAVAAVAARHDLDEDGATLWLQLATLAEPVPERLRRTNGWTAARMRAAEQALLRRGLAVEASHGGGRSVWLPGPVASASAPATALEASKLPLYGLEPDARGRLRAPFGVVLPLRPLPELFAEAARR